MDLLESIRNRCDAALLLIKHDANHLLATLLEDIHEDSQIIIDEYCVEKEED